MSQVTEELDREKALLSQVREELRKEEEVVSRVQEELETSRAGGDQEEGGGGGGGGGKEEVARLEERLQQLEESRTNMEKVYRSVTFKEETPL